MGVLLRGDTSTNVGVPSFPQKEQRQLAVLLFCRQHSGQPDTSGSCRIDSQFQINSEREQLRCFIHCLLPFYTAASAHYVLLAEVENHLEGGK